MTEQRSLGSRTIAGIQDDSNIPKDERVSPMRKNEKDVQSVMTNIQTWINPLEFRERDALLVNIVSYVIASQEVLDALLSAKSVGEQ